MTALQPPRLARRRRLPRGRPLHRPRGRAPAGRGGGLLPGGPAAALAVHRRLDVRVEHLGRALRRPRRQRLRDRHGDRRLRVDGRLLHRAARRALPAVLRPEPHLHRARVPGAPLLARRAAAVLRPHGRALGADEGLDLAVGLVDRLLRHPRLAAILGHLGRGPRDVPLHDEGRPAGGRLHRRPADRPCCSSPPWC